MLFLGASNGRRRIDTLQLFSRITLAPARAFDRALTTARFRPRALNHTLSAVRADERGGVNS